APTAIRQPADGHSLRATSDRSCQLVCAHGVFVYLSFLNVFECLGEVARVCALGGHLVFDCFTEEEFTPGMIDKWLSASARYPVVIPRACILGYLSARSFHLL